MATEEKHHVTCTCVQCKRSEKILRDRLALYTESLHYDCTISVGKEKPIIIKCHKMILASASEPFNKMLYSDFSEGNKGKDDPITINDDISPEAFEFVMKYIYGKVGDFPDMSIACDVYKFAHKWLIDDLMDAAAEKLNTAKPDEIIPVYETFKHVGNGHELQTALKTIEENISEVFSSRHWIKAASSTIFEIFEQPILKVESEKDLFDALIKWGEANSESVADLQSIVAEPLKLIRFRTMNPKDFAELCSEHADVFSLEEKFQILMSTTLGDPKQMPPNFTAHDKNRKTKNSFCHTLFGDKRIVSDATLNSGPVTFIYTFSMSGDFPNYVSHVTLDCLSLEGNYGREADLICSLTKLESGKQVGVAKFKGKISSDSDKELKFIRPVRIVRDSWYELCIKYFNQDILCTKKYEYKPWTNVVWKSIHESLIMKIKDPANSHNDIGGLYFLY